MSDEEMKQMMREREEGQDDRVESEGPDGLEIYIYRPRIF